MTLWKAIFPCDGKSTEGGNFVRILGERRKSFRSQDRGGKSAAAFAPGSAAMLCRPGAFDVSSAKPLPVLSPANLPARLFMRCIRISAPAWLALRAMPCRCNISSGIISEHLHTRAQAGLFDVSHMGQAILEGPRPRAVWKGSCRAISKTLAPGRMRYTQLLDADGHILDDLMVTRLADEGGRERFFLVVNAATKRADFAHLAAELPGCDSDHSRRSRLARLARAEGGGGLEPAPRARRGRKSHGAALHVGGELGVGRRDLDISRSGYTGEDGFEISIPAVGRGRLRAATARRAGGSPDWPRRPRFAPSRGRPLPLWS